MENPLPHRYDRYRLLGILSKYHPSSENQEDLGTKLQRHQSTISRMISLTSLEERALTQQVIRRSSLLKFACDGMHLNYQETSLFLWLALGINFRPLTQQETDKYTCLARNLTWVSEAEEYQREPFVAYWAAIDWIKATLAKPQGSSALYELRTLMLHGNSPENRLEFYRKLLELEARPGQRLVVSKYPSILVSEEVDKSDEELLLTPTPLRGQLRQLLIRRREKHKQNIEDYGERTIHSISSLRRFVSSGFEHKISVEERRRRVEALIAHLNSYKHFHVGLADLEPEVEIAIKSTESTVIRGTARELSNHPKTLHCGPSYLFWVDKEVKEPWGVAAFFLDFEDEWRKLWAEKKTDKKYVIEQLELILEEERAKDNQKNSSLATTTA
jgi:hypothetical protein